LGQANAIQTAEPFIDDYFFVLNANDLFESWLLQSVVVKGKEHSANLVLIGRRVAEPWRFGVMRFDAGGNLVGVIEKPPAGQEPSDVAVIGAYYFSPEIFRCIRQTPLGTDDQLERAYQLLIDRGQATYIAYDGLFESFKYPWNLLTMNDLLLAESIQEQQISPLARISDRAIIDGPVVIDDDVRVFENAIIRGPAYVGPGSVIGNNSLIWGGCSFGPGCVIGYGSEIKHSVFGRNVWTHRNYIGDSIVADNCSFGAGTITANYRFDEQNVTVSVKGEQMDSGYDKLGIIMAEGCRTGCNSVLMPGVKVGPNSIVGPGITLADDLPPHKIALQVKSSYRIQDNRLDLTQSTREKQMRKLGGV
jgi:bifunctional UDP-N-acetylglucosamine pyrophosphorylase/glucosamine-1-phosphate N-acetyltransferase